jgi:hypothetical protein
VTTFVYVPVRDKGFDEFAAALVIAKNHVHGAGAYALLDRDDPKPLSAVTNGDRLYVGIHGSKSGRVYVMTPNSYEEPDTATLMRGSALTTLLVQKGLPKVTMRLYLWVCWSGATTEDAGPNRALRTPVVTQVASSLRWRGYSRVTVIGYTEKVNINPLLILADGHRSLLVGADHPPTDDRRTIEAARSFWQRAQ